MGDSQGGMTGLSILFQSKPLTAEPAAAGPVTPAAGHRPADTARVLAWLFSLKEAPAKQTLMKHYLEGLH